ncbi:serine protease inhibitor [Schinkia azotoformans MEV2011]|uniref:Serine protease inhibitor n=1 Tax=Schinkia azotoformans MEV2011 TaxID=1348973 RepID=A0A072NKZ5_SCHAZ|nr:serpin family protein [Schinkia azotoformans]KEF37942.1 serine protease inhibitor [Schinkia azotoformans MEV2011]MEC1696301.1 serpin family protein [Schinkia azotoformans]MEC1727259.1 serpin family protein [Schinkia azotoformans]MEC1770817.1 serpin family protein [Schinkia azotoformans]MEC1780819.1 serpin family protein [Schinkia azotoformans]
MKGFYFILSLILFLTGCGSSSSPDFGSAKFGKDDYKMITEANNRFAFKLLDELIKNKEEQNTFFSPFSIHSALSMTFNGAASDTQKELAKVLQVSDYEPSDINRAYASFLSRTYERNYEATLNIANSLWLKEGYPFLEDFVTKTEDYYLAKVSEMDFSDPKTTDEINQWVKQKTNGKIEKMIENIESNTVAYLINAIYFYGEWDHSFDEKQTFEDTFYVSKDQSQKLPFMRQTNEFKYFEDELIQVIDLPYKDNELSMIVILPKEGTSLDDFYQQLTYDQWVNRINQFNKQEVSITLPKFKMDYSTNLNDSLINLGMPSAFSSNADFSRMVENGGVCIDEVLHKSYIEVNEKGTEAAAATSVEMQEAASPVMKIMNVNHPFFFVIQDNESEIILFMGEVHSPEVNKK